MKLKNQLLINIKEIPINLRNLNQIRNNKEKDWNSGGPSVSFKMMILDKYYGPINPGSFSGLSGFLKNNNVNKIEAKKFVQSTETYKYTYTTDL